MKIKGKDLQSPYEEVIVLPRGGDGSKDIIFTVRAVLDFSEFDKLCPEPVPPKKSEDGGKTWTYDASLPSHRAARGKNSQLWWDWMHIKAISATEGLEWERVKLDDPATWCHWRDELLSSGLVKMEAAKVIGAVEAVMALDDKKIEAARDRFFARRAAAVTLQTSQAAEPTSTPSSVPANASA